MTNTPGSEAPKADRKNMITQMWLISLAISVLCCALFLMLTSFYVTDINKNLAMIDMRLSSIESHTVVAPVAVAPVAPAPAPVANAPAPESAAPVDTVEPAANIKVDVPSLPAGTEAPAAAAPVEAPAPPAETAPVSPAAQ